MIERICIIDEKLLHTSSIKFNYIYDYFRYFIIVDINVLIYKHQVAPLLLSSISLIIFIMLFVVALFKCITNYKHQS